ncbi:MAG: DUF1150 family protein [Beijerinckiaceae bacterium]|jgi:hypothetical protein
MLNQNNNSVPLPLSDEQFAHLGGGMIAYVKPIRSEDVSRLFPQVPPVQPGLQLFALLGADGSPILLTDSRAAAVANAHENELMTVSLH